MTQIFRKFSLPCLVVAYMILNAAILASGANTDDDEELHVSKVRVADPSPVFCDSFSDEDGYGFWPADTASGSGSGRGNPVEGAQLPPPPLQIHIIYSKNIRDMTANCIDSFLATSQRFQKITSTGAGGNGKGPEGAGGRAAGPSTTSTSSGLSWCLKVHYLPLSEASKFQGAGSQEEAKGTVRGQQEGADAAEGVAKSDFSKYVKNYYHDFLEIKLKKFAEVVEECRKEKDTARRPVDPDRTKQLRRDRQRLNIRKTRPLGCRWLLLIDADAQVFPGWDTYIDHLIAEAERSNTVGVFQRENSKLVNTGLMLLRAGEDSKGQISFLFEQAKKIFAPRGGGDQRAIQKVLAAHGRRIVLDPGRLAAPVQVATKNSLQITPSPPAGGEDPPSRPVEIEGNGHRFRMPNRRENPHQFERPRVTNFPGETLPGDMHLQQDPLRMQRGGGPDEKNGKTKGTGRTFLLEPLLYTVFDKALVNAGVIEAQKSTMLVHHAHMSGPHKRLNLREGCEFRWKLFTNKRLNSKKIVNEAGEEVKTDLKQKRPLIEWEERVATEEPRASAFFLKEDTTAEKICRKPKLLTLCKRISRVNSMLDDAEQQYIRSKSGLGRDDSDSSGEGTVGGEVKMTRRPRDPAVGVGTTLGENTDAGANEGEVNAKAVPDADKKGIRPTPRPLAAVSAGKMVSSRPSAGREQYPAGPRFSATLRPTYPPNYQNHSFWEGNELLLVLFIVVLVCSRRLWMSSNRRR
jgi:hypothetical protein